MRPEAPVGNGVVRSTVAIVAHVAAFGVMSCVVQTVLAEDAHCPKWNDEQLHRLSSPGLAENIISNLMFAYASDPTRRVLGSEENLKVTHDRYLFAVNCKAPDGSFLMRYMSAGFGKAIQYAQGDWDLLYQNSRAYQAKYPGDPFGALSEAAYWRDYGWDARGTGYSSDVPPEKLKLFEERLEKAKATLVQTKTYASTVPIWYEMMIGLQGALGNPFEGRAKVFSEGAARYPEFSRIYLIYANYLIPKWGGSWKLVDDVARFAVQNTNNVAGRSFYAMVYSSVDRDLSDDQRLFKTTLAQWPEMKRSLDDLVRYQPGAWTLNRYASFACEANDSATYHKVRRLVGTDVLPEVWVYNVTMDFCDLKYGYID